MFFCFFSCLIIFDWMPDIVNFAFLIAEYFCISVFWDVVRSGASSLTDLVDCAPEAVLSLCY